MQIKLESFVLLLAVGVIAAHGADSQPAEPATAKATPKPMELFADKAVAKGKGVEIKRSQLDDQVIRFKAGMSARGQTLSAEQTPYIERQLLDQLILVQLLNAKATEADRAAGKLQAEKKMQEGKAQYGSDEALDRQLKASGTTREELLKQWTEAAAGESALKRDIVVTVTDEDVKKFYQDNPSKFEQPEMVRAAHVLIKTTDTTNTELGPDQKDARRKLAEEILKRARAGEDFAKLAKEYSEDPGSKDRGGEYTFPRGQMVPEFETAAFSMNTNQVSDLVTTRFGFHIIKLLEKFPAKKVELATVSARVKEALTEDAIRKRLPDYYKKLSKEANIEIVDEKLKAIEPAAEPGPGSEATKSAGKPAQK